MVYYIKVKVKDYPISRVVQKWPDQKTRTETESKPTRIYVPFLALSNQHYTIRNCTRTGCQRKMGKLNPSCNRFL